MVTTGLGIRRLLRLLDCEFLASMNSAPKTETETSYVLSIILKKIFMIKCNLSMLRLTPTLTLAALPIALTPLISYHKRVRPPPSLLTPLLEAIILASFPLAWFYGFLYYTEVPSLVSVALTVVFASREKHWLAALVRLLLHMAWNDDSRRTGHVRPASLAAPSARTTSFGSCTRTRPANSCTSASGAPYRVRSPLRSSTTLRPLKRAQVRSDRLCLRCASS